MPTVAYYTPGWPAAAVASGIASYVERLAHGLQGSRWRPAILAGRLEDRGPGPALPCYPVLRRSLLDRALGRLTRRWPDPLSLVPRGVIARQRRHRFDLIEIEESFGWAGAIAAGVEAPVVVRLHGPWFLTGAASGLAGGADYEQRVRREGEGLAAAAAVTAPSQHVLDRVRQFYGLPLAHAVVIPNPAPAPQPLPAAIDLPDWSGRVVLYVGRFELLKGGDLAVAAFAELAAGDPDLHCVFLGPDLGVPGGDGGRIGIAAYADRCFPAAARARFHYLGQQPPAVVGAWLRRADVVVVPARFENFPMVVLEAMQAGRPVVATRVGGIPELIAADVTGLLVEPEQVPAVAAAVRRLLDAPDFAAGLGRRAQQVAAVRFSPAAIALTTAGFYDDVLRRWPGPRRS